jgi:hypothetical protein
MVGAESTATACSRNGRLWNSRFWRKAVIEPIQYVRGPLN